MQDYHTEMPFGDKEDMSPLLLKDGPEVEEKREHSSTKRGPSGWAVIDSLQHSFNPSIEGLRGIAVSLTMICHILQEQYQFREVAGNMGVCIFFVLSGFLITAVLIRLQSESGTKLGHLTRFYTDRFFRLGPALFLVVGLVWPLQYRAGNDMTYVNKYGALALLYLGNWPSLRPKPDATGPWGNTWSLACEEQFYIIWALILPFILPRTIGKRAAILATSIAVLLFGFRIYASMYDGALFGLDWRFGLLANMWKMLIGASLRLIPTPTWLLKRGWAYVGLLGFTITLALSFLNQPNYSHIAPMWADGMRPLLAWADISSCFFTALLLCGISGKRGGIALLELHPVRFVGRVSYAWYLWQVPIIELDYWRRGYPGIGDTAMAFIMAMISTLYVEEPINKAYKRWKARKDGVVHSPA